MTKINNSKKNRYTVRRSEFVVKKALTALDKYNLEHYADHISLMSHFDRLSCSTRDWIETNRFKLQGSANKYEHMVGKYLIDHNIRFDHQRPFSINKKLYFADFYLPLLNIIIEVDGASHQPLKRREEDCDRDATFRYRGIRTIRIPNNEAMDSKRLHLHLVAEGIVPRKLVRK